MQSRKSRDTWSNRQIRPWSTKWSRAKANRVLPRKCTGHSKHPLPTTWDKTLHKDITRWSTPKSDWLYSMQPKMEKLYTKTRPGADCGSDHELFIAKFRLKLKKVRKTTRPLREEKSLNRVRLFATPWTVAHQAPQSVGFSRHEYWNGLPFPSPDQTIEVWPKSNPLRLYSWSDKQIQGIRSDRQSTWRTMDGGL